MFGTSILDNVSAFVFWAVFFSNAVVFWMSLSIVKKQVSFETVATIWKEHDGIQMACFFSLIMTTSFEEALVNRPRSRVIHTGFVGLFFFMLLTGLSFNSIRSALLNDDRLLLLNYVFWILAALLAGFQSIRVVNGRKQEAVT